ncbi:MAG: CAP domain-containing protein [Gemmataceae bacterium]
MFTKCFAIFLTFGWLLVPTGAFGQAVEEEPVETIQAPDIKSANAEKPDLSRVAELIIEKTNAFRKEQDRPRVQPDPKLMKTAQYFADFMAKEDKYGHTADGQHPADRAKKHGYDYCIVLENIAFQYNSAGFKIEKLAQNFIDAWKESSGHRKNMLDPDVIDTGVAIAYSEKTAHYYAVQMFGRPKSKAIEFKLTNQADTAIEYRVGDKSYSLQPRYTRTHELCRPADLTVDSAQDKSQSKSDAKAIKPASGDHFVVSKDKGTYQIKKE